MSINTDDNIWSSIEKLDIPKMFTLFSILFLLLSNFYLILYYDFFGISIYSYISPSEILLLIMPNLVIVIVSVLVILAIITTPIIGLALLTRALRNFIFYPLLRIIYKLILKKEYNKIDNIADNRNDTNFFENNTLLQYLIIVYILLYQGFFYLNEPFKLEI